ncbi:MAG: glycosyltransferase family 2 protein [Ruminococcus sp.]
MNKKISIIVAAYNVSKYIEKCVGSILSQSYENIEVIIVEDGSTDETPKICDRLAKTDNRIKVIHQDNQGLSEARNNGIKAASGDLISLIDGDDVVESDFLQNMISVMGEDIHVVIGGYKTVNDEGGIVSTMSLGNGLMTGEEATIKLLAEQDDLFVVAWNKLYRKDLFTKNNIWYPAGKIHEDNLTTYKLLSKAKKVKLVNSADYLYVKRAGSITSESKKDIQIREKINSAKEAIEFFPDGDLHEAAVYSLFLAHIIELNEAIHSRSVNKYKAIINNILMLKPDKNKFCTSKGRAYMSMLKILSGKPYIAFRKIIDKVL